MRAGWVYSCFVMVLCIYYSMSDPDMTDCQVRCPDGRVCVRLEMVEGSNFHLCVRPASLSAMRARGFGVSGNAGQSSLSSSRQQQQQQQQQMGAGLSVEGRGQALCLRPPVPPGPCVVQCVSDSDCQDNQACCSTGCGYICDFLEPGAMAKPGSCPSLSGTDREQCGAPCRGDRECPGHTKCCRTRCGKTCQAPCFHWRSHGIHSNPWRLSHRCSTTESD